LIAQAVAASESNSTTFSTLRTASKETFCCRSYRRQVFRLAIGKHFGVGLPGSGMEGVGCLGLTGVVKLAGDAPDR
jgi:hypothetical protein